MTIMKKIKFLLAFVLTALFIGFSACSNEDDGVELKLEKNTVEVEKDSTVTIKIIEGNGNYSAISIDKKIAESSVEGNIISIKGRSTGSTTIQLHDKRGKATSITVNVFSIVGEWTAKTPTVTVEGVTDKEKKEIEDNFKKNALESVKLNKDETFEMKSADDGEDNTGTYTYAANSLIMNMKRGEVDIIFTIKVAELTKTSLNLEYDGMNQLEDIYPSLTKAIVNYTLSKK